MSKDLDSSPVVTGHDLATHETLVATPLAHKLQTIGQRMLGSGRLLEVEENVFSTCQDPIEDLVERLERARDTGVPLVEATVLPMMSKYGRIRELFGKEDGLVQLILRSRGQIDESPMRSPAIKFEEVGIMLDQDDKVLLRGYERNQVESHLHVASRHIEAGQRDRVSGWFAYEHSLGLGLVPPDAPAISKALDLISEDFEVAIMRDGSIEGSVVEELSEDRRLTSE